MDIKQQKQFLLHSFQALLNHSQDMIFIKDKDLIYVSASNSFAQMVGYEYGSDLTGKTDFDLFAYDLAKKYTEDDKTLLNNANAIVNYIEPLPDKNGHKNYSSTSKYIVHDDAGEIIGLYGIAKDVTAQIELAAAKESSNLSRQMFDYILEADLTENKMICSQDSELTNCLGINNDSSFCDAVEHVKSLVHPDYVDDFLDYYNLEKLKTDYLNGVYDFNHITYFRKNPDELEYRFVDFATRVYHSRVSNTLRISTFLKDVDNEIRSKRKLEYEATTDVLTGLDNRATVLSKIRESLYSGDEEYTNALLFIDLDCFKEVNDRWGHKFGDEVLQATARQLKNIFGMDNIYGRIGGDEFLVFLRQVESKEAVKVKAEQAVENLSFYQNKNGEEINVTCSIGIALCRNGELSAEHLYEQADQAMYRAKEKGRNRLFFFEDM